MASPFRLFRKHVKPLLVIFTCLLILAWLGGGALTNVGSASRKAADDRDARAVAVHWDGGKLTNQQLHDLVTRRKVVNGFLKQLIIEGQAQAAQAGVDPPPLRVQPLIEADTPQEGVERSVVRSKLLADSAREAGMKVSDEAVVKYLDDLGRGNVSRERMRTILGAMGNAGLRFSIEYIIDALREEMLARNFRNSHEFAFQTVTPQQRWEDWLRVNHRVVIEAAAVPAESFLVDVKEPSEAELVAFFDKYKDREAGPDFIFGTTEVKSATPGFKMPRKIDLHFIEANFDAFVAKAEEKITEEEIAKYYDEHKSMFEKADTGLMEEGGTKKDGQKPDKSAKDGAEKAEDAKDKNKPAEKEKQSAEPDAKKATEPAPTEKKPPASPKDNKEAAPAEKKQSSSRNGGSKSVFQLAAFAEDAKKSDTGADKSDAKSESKTGTGETPAAKSSPADKDAGKADTKPAGNTEKPAAAPASTSDATKTAPAGPADASKAAPPALAPPTNKKPVQYQPLSEVKDQIRRLIAEGSVAEKLNKLTGDIQGQLETDFNKWFNDELLAKSDKHEPTAPPKSLTDLAAVAEKNGLKHERTGPKSVLELREMPIGKSAIVDSNRGLLAELFTTRQVELYQPVATVDFDGNRFISVKMSDTPAHVPTLAEVRSEVVKAWKAQKAAELALKRAEELAKKAQDEKKSLTDFFAEDKAVKVVRTDPFSELTGGDVSVATGQLQPYRLSQPGEIAAPGPEFMKRVFELKDDEVGAALNNDHSIAYVVRIVEHQPSLAELRNTYLAVANTWPGFYSMTQDHAGRAYGELLNEIVAGANLQWDRVPDKTTRDEERDEG